MGRLLLVAALLGASAAQACGYCVEDKIAAVYDHAVVTGALKRSHHVVFFHVDGKVAPGDAGRRALTAAASTVADRETVRVSPDNLTFSLAFDPRRTSLVSLQRGLEKRLAADGLTLLPMRIIEKPAELKALAR